MPLLFTEPQCSFERSEIGIAETFSCLAAVRSLFESHGYAATTLEAIAEIALVSPKTIAAVFGSKRTLLAEVINPDAFSTPVQQFIEELRATKTPERAGRAQDKESEDAFEKLRRDGYM